MVQSPVNPKNKVAVGSTVLLKSVNYPDRYIQHENDLGELTGLSSGSESKNAIFVVREGLAGGNSITFESFNRPGHYLRHQGFRIKLHKNDDSDLFHKDASFTPVPSTVDGALSFESVNYPGYYLRHCSFHLYIDNNQCNNGDCDPTPDVYKKDVAFVVEPAKNAQVVIFADNNYGGRSQTLKVGYNAGYLAVGNDVVSSVKVPKGYKVTLYEHGPGNGRTKVLTEDTASLPDFDNITSNVLVELIEVQDVVIFADNNYGGRSQTLKVGYNAGYLAVGNDVVSSVKVPKGYKVTLYEHSPGNGRVKVLTEDTASLPDFDNITSNVLVECIEDTPAANLASRIALRATINNKFVCAEGAGADKLIANRSNAYSGDANGNGSWEIFEVVPMATNRIALRATINNKFVSVNKEDRSLRAAVDRASAATDSTEIFEVQSMGEGRIALRAVCNNLYVCAEKAGELPLMASREHAYAGDANGNGSWEIFEYTAMPIK